VNNEHADENRFEQESTAFFTRVQLAFRAIAAREPQRVEMVDARRPAEIVHPEIVSIVRNRLLNATRPTRSANQDLTGSSDALR